MPRRRCPKHEARRAVSGIQWRLLRERRTATARHPYLLERGALRAARSTESCGGFVVWRSRRLQQQRQVVLAATLTYTQS